MNDPQKIVWLARVAAIFLVAATVCSEVNAQSFYQQTQPAVGTNESANGKTAWQQPQVSGVKRQSAIRQATNMVPLKPPRDIFVRDDRSLTKPPTKPPARPVTSTAWNQFDAVTQIPKPAVSVSTSQRERFSTSGQFDGARRLGNSQSSPSTGKSLFDSINALTDAGQPEFASANLDTKTIAGRSNLEALTSDATAKFGDAKNWVGEKTDAILAGMKDGGWQERVSRMFGGADIKRIIGGLAVVIGGYLGLVWLLKIINPAGSGAIPREALEVVGSAPLNSKQNLQLIRLGSKLMLMIHGPDGTQPIGEVSDPAEVEHLLAICSGGGRRQRVSPAIGAAIENRLRSAQQSTAPERNVAHQQNQPGQQNGSVSLSPDDSNNLNQLLRALEKYQRPEHLYEA
jgi:flagellar biogenesis protein FliO